MTNGFFRTDKLTKAQKKKIIKEAIGLSFTVLCQEKYRGDSSSREVYPDLTINQLIEEGLNNKLTMFTIVDRVLYNNESFNELTDYEICLSYDWRFLYIFASRENFYYLVNKYKLKLTEI